MAGPPTVHYLTVQYRFFTLVPFVPYDTENVPFFEYTSILEFMAQIQKKSNNETKNAKFPRTFPAKFNLNWNVLHV